MRLCYNIQKIFSASASISALSQSFFSKIHPALMAEVCELQVIDEEVEDSKSLSESSDAEEDVLSKEGSSLNYSSPDDFLHLKKELLKEFDSLGIGSLSEESYSEANLVTNAYCLVNIHRKTLAQVKESNISNAKLKADNVRLEKQINVLRKTLVEKSSVIADLNKNLTLTKMTCDDLGREKLELQQELQNARKSIGIKDIHWEHKMKQLEADMEKLRNVNEKSIGNFTSRDAITASVIQKYKTNEVYYKETIRTLHENNQGLIRELLNLLEQGQENLTDHK